LIFRTKLLAHHLEEDKEKVFSSSSKKLITVEFNKLLWKMTVFSESSPARKRIIHWVWEGNGWKFFEKISSFLFLTKKEFDVSNRTFWFWFLKSEFCQFWRRSTKNLAENFPFKDSFLKFPMTQKSFTAKINKGTSWQTTQYHFDQITRIYCSILTQRLFS